MSRPAKLTEAHYQVFGVIITLYARAEESFRTALAMLLQTSVEAVVLLSAPYTTAQLRNVLKSTAKLTLVEGPALDKLVHLIGDHGSVATLRNHIAHAQWEEGSEPLSIRPVFGDVKQGRFQMFGSGGKVVEYTTEELTRIHNLAIDLNAKLYDFLISEEFEQALVGKRSLHDLRFWMDQPE